MCVAIKFCDRKTKRPEPTFEDEIQKDIIITDLLDEKPPEKIILDIQDTRRYFESQTGGLDEKKLSENDTINLLVGYKRKFGGWQPEMTNDIINPRAADKVCVELTNIIKKKIRHDDRSAAGKRVFCVKYI